MLYKRKKKQPDGTFIELPTIWIKYYQNGRPVRESTRTNKETVARRILRTREGDVERGVPINPKMGLVTFEEAAADLLNDYTVNGRKTHDHAKRRIELHLTPAFQGKRLLSITTPAVRAFITARLAAGASNGEINRELACLKRMLRWRYTPANCIASRISQCSGRTTSAAAFSNRHSSTRFAIVSRWRCARLSPSRT